MESIPITKKFISKQSSQSLFPRSMGSTELFLCMVRLDQVKPTLCWESTQKKSERQLESIGEAEAIKCESDQEAEITMQIKAPA